MKLKNVIVLKGTSMSGLKILLSVLLGFTASSSAAANRPDIRKMACQEVQTLVKRERAIVLTFTQYTYDRVVSNRSSCDAGYQGKRINKATRDQAKCNIGYVCVPSGSNGSLFSF